MHDVAGLIERYGTEAKKILSGPGEQEAALARPVANLLEGYGNEVLNRNVVLHEEVREADGSVRPDYGIRVDGLMTGHIELKRPGTPLDPSTYGKSTHNYRQWQRLRNLPNLLHTNGVEWRLWRYGELVGDPVWLHTTSLKAHRGPLMAPANFNSVMTNFLSWAPTPINSISKLVDTIAPLAMLLREEVLLSLRSDRRFLKEHGADCAPRPFIGLKGDWQRSLSPLASDEEFADGFAQTVVFSLVIGLSEGLDLSITNVSDIALQLEAKHSLLGRSLELLTEHIGQSAVGAVIETIIRALSATNWTRISQGRQDIYLHLYEHFLSGYDPELRKQSGSYYTPIEIVDGMTRLTQVALQKYLQVDEGFSSESVAVIDPAMGTGTYPLAVLRQVAKDAAKYGPGAIADAVDSAAKRIYGIELQSGPFSVAELRMTQAIREMGADLPKDGLNLYVADTLEDPKSASSQQLSYTLQLIAQQRQKANRVKLETPIQVCIGNPPYKRDAQGLGGWIEKGDGTGTGTGTGTPLDDFRLENNGKYEYVLKNLYVYFWRWALWKVFESVQDSRDGVVCFITATGFLQGPGFKGMREWIRRNTSRGWIINLTPEGLQPPADTAVFNIETPVAISLFIRDAENDPEVPSEIYYAELHGTRDAKFEALNKLDLDDELFTATDLGWTDKFVPRSEEVWLSYPLLNDLFPWTAPGIKPNKTWVYAPSSDLLEARWFDMVEESDLESKRIKFKETSSTSIDKTQPPLPSLDAEQNTRVPIKNVNWPQKPSIVPVGFRSLDRQYIIADSRLLHRASPKLWSARIEGQLFMTELHDRALKPGPGMTVTDLIPDMHHFKGSEGGRVLPLLHADGTPNIAPGLLGSLSLHFGIPVSENDLAAYVAAVTSHSGYVETFGHELQYDSDRIPITSNSALWAKGVETGMNVIWYQTFGKRGRGPAGTTSVLDATADVTMPSYDTSVGAEMPEKATYDHMSRVLRLGKGRWTNVNPRVWEYQIGGTNVIESWVGYRRKRPKGRTSSPLDRIVATSWSSQLSREFHELLSVVTHLVQLELHQSSLLAEIIAGETLTRFDFEGMGVKWPSTDADRKPKGPADHKPTMF